jgi:ABC-type multidrug transport system fused ATPase/permease subunit
VTWLRENDATLAGGYNSSGVTGDYITVTGDYITVTSDYTTVTGHYSNTTMPYVNQYQNLWIYACIVLSVFVFGLLRALFIFFAMLTSSRRLHNDMFASVVRSRIIFFDTNPIGKCQVKFIGTHNKKLATCMLILSD